jgi:DNA-binding MarR family transcriptional regulator
VLVRLTDEGRTKVDGALATLLEREQELLAGLDTASQQRLASLLRRLVAGFEPEE